MWSFFKNLTNTGIVKPQILLIGIYLKKITVTSTREGFMSIFTVISLTTAKKWTQVMSPCTNKGEKMLPICMKKEGNYDL